MESIAWSNDDLRAEGTDRGVLLIVRKGDRWAVQAESGGYLTRTFATSDEAKAHVDLYHQPKPRPSR